MSKILVADDNAQNLYLVRFLLEKSGHDVDEVVNGELAVKAVENKPYDLVLMDIRMPVLNGIEATRAIKLKAGAPKIVALTASAMDGDEESIIAAGCDGYIAKPIVFDTFVDLVEAYLDSEANPAV